jgi:nitrogen fixation/metabolism regulation signal transduction histidine kinase
MKRICAWCGKDLEKPSEYAAPADGPISHGICSECVDFLIRNDRQSLAAFLDRLTVPVLLVDARNTVILSNQSARAMFGAGSAANGEGSAPLVGTAIECAHARLPMGCGETVHCVACQIRASVRTTQQTGMALKNVEAFREVKSSLGEKRLRVRISTEKLGEAVLLRIEPVAESGAAPCPPPGT